MTSQPEDEGEDFDAAGHVATFRRIIAQRDAETTPEGKAEFEAIAQRLKKQWAAWQGEDSLYEMAFGEPFDD